MNSFVNPSDTMNPIKSYMQEIVHAGFIFNQTRNMEVQVRFSEFRGGNPYVHETIFSGNRQKNLYSTTRATDTEKYFDEHFYQNNQFLNIFITLDPTYSIVRLYAGSFQQLFATFGGLAFCLYMVGAFISSAAAKRARDRSLVKRSYQVQLFEDDVV